MAINNPRIAAGPTKPRIQILDQPVQTYPAGPGETYFSTISGSPAAYTVPANPTREGQIFFHVDSDGANRTAVMYVGVDISGTLTWVEADFSSYVDGYSGRNFDPLFS